MVGGGKTATIGAVGLRRMGERMTELGGAREKERIGKQIHPYLVEPVLSGEAERGTLDIALSLTSWTCES